MKLTANEIEIARAVLAVISEDCNDRALAVCKAADSLLAAAHDDRIDQATACCGAYLQPGLTEGLLRVAQMRGEFESVESVIRISRARFGVDLSLGDALTLVALYRTTRPDALLFEHDVVMDVIRWFFATYAQHEVIDDGACSPSTDENTATPFHGRD